jgi:hypothetical protein
MRTPLECLLGEVPNYTFFKVFGFASWPHLHPYNELRLEKELGVSEEVGIRLVPRRRFYHQVCIWVIICKCILIQRMLMSKIPNLSLKYGPFGWSANVA